MKAELTARSATDGEGGAHQDLTVYVDSAYVVKPLYLCQQEVLEGAGVKPGPVVPDRAGNAGQIC